MPETEDKCGGKCSCKTGKEENPGITASAGVESFVETASGKIPVINDVWNWKDRLGALKVRLNIGRTRYRVAPGLYAMGTPDSSSPVVVTANYKLTFDVLRRCLKDRSLWILVLDTKGINVWCAAGKGTFGTKELLRSIDACGLYQVVSHWQVIVPQLGAPGVSAQEVLKQSGFHVVYGPVRARDLPAFLDAGMKAQPEMRLVRFNFWDRIVVTPVECVVWFKYLLMLCVLLFLLGSLGRGGCSWPRMLTEGGRAVEVMAIAYFAHHFLMAALLPSLPSRAFSVKGLSIGFLLWVVMLWYQIIPWKNVHMQAWAFCFMLCAMCSFLGLTFTGSTTFTSRSGVRKEILYAVPAQIFAGALGFTMWVVARFW